MTAQKIGYIRVSSHEQNTARQLVGIELDRVFEEKVSAKTRERPLLEEMIAFVREGDTVFVHSLDRLARNLDDLRWLVKTIVGKGAKVSFVKESLVFDGDDSPMSNLLLSIMGSFAEFERALIKDRQMEGIALAVEKGLYTGRRPSLSDEQAEALRDDFYSDLSKTVLAEKYGVTRQTIYNYEKAFLAEQEDAEKSDKEMTTVCYGDMECDFCGEMMDKEQFTVEVEVGEDAEQYLFDAECEHCGERFGFQFDTTGETGEGMECS